MFQLKCIVNQNACILINCVGIIQWIILLKLNNDVNEKLNLNATNKKASILLYHEVGCHGVLSHFHCFHWWCTQSNAMSFKRFLLYAADILALFIHLVSMYLAKFFKTLINLIIDNSACIRLLIAFVSISRANTACLFNPR